MPAQPTCRQFAMTHGGVVAMKCWIVCSLLATALLASRGSAQEEPAPLAGGNYYADAATPIDGNCPDGYTGGHGHHGHHGLYANHTYPPHWGLAYASGYPNGIINYGNEPHARDWKGPGLGCRSCSNGECLYR